MDVHTIGAGPAGSIAAMAAVRNGYRVLLSEEHPVAGEPVHCSGLFSGDGLGRLRDFADYSPLIINSIYGAIVNVAGVRLDVVRKQPVAYVCDRAGLDRLLAENAAADGVRVEYGKRITGGYAAPLVIGADGPFSSVARHFDFPRITQYASTLQAHVPYACEDPRRVEVYVSNENFPGFFAWVIPQNEELAEFGVGVTVPSRLSSAWRALLKMKGVRYEKTPKGAAIPIRVRAKTAGTFGRSRVCLVGDAAGQTKSTTGGGVVFGGQCGMLAGKYAADPWKYELGWKLQHGTELLAHRMAHSYLARAGDSHLRQLGSFLRTLQFDRYLSSHGHMDRPTRMLGLNLVTHLLSIPFNSSPR